MPLEMQRLQLGPLICCTAVEEVREVPDCVAEIQFDQLLGEGSQRTREDVEAKLGILDHWR